MMLRYWISRSRAVRVGGVSASMAMLLAMAGNTPSPGAAPHHAPRTVSPGAAAARLGMLSPPRDQRFEMIIQVQGRAKVVGYDEQTYGPAIWHGQRVWRMTETIHIEPAPHFRLNSSDTTYVRSDGARLQEHHIVDDLLKRATTDAVFRGNEIDASVVRAVTGSRVGVKQRVKITMPEGQNLSPDFPYALAASDLQPGNVVQQDTFDPSAVKVVHATITVNNQGNVELPGHRIVKAWRLTIQSGDDPNLFTVWQTSGGGIVRLQLDIQGIQIIGVLTRAKG